MAGHQPWGRVKQRCGGQSTRRPSPARMADVFVSANRRKVSSGKQDEDFRPNHSPVLKCGVREPYQHHANHGPNRRSFEASSDMAPALQISTDLRGGEMHALSRAAILSRYRRYRDIRTDIQTTVLENIPHSRFLECARRIGLSDGKLLFTNNQVELTLAFDLALYTANPGRTRAIDRCARKRLETSGPDETLVLKGLQASRFSIFRVIRRCEPAGVLLEDLMRGGVISHRLASNPQAERRLARTCGSRGRSKTVTPATPLEQGSRPAPTFPAVFERSGQWHVFALGWLCKAQDRRRASVRPDCL